MIYMTNDESKEMQIHYSLYSVYFRLNKHNAGS